jgi:hypothetical protein
MSASSAELLTLLPDDDDPCGELPAPEIDFNGALASGSCFRKRQVHTAGGDRRRVAAREAAIVQNH